MSLPIRERLDLKGDAREILATWTIGGALQSLVYLGIPPLIVFLGVGACVHRTWLWSLTLLAGLLVQFAVMVVWAPTVVALKNSRSVIAWFSHDATHEADLSLQELASERLSSCIPAVLAAQFRDKYKYEFLNTTTGRLQAGLGSTFLPLRVFIVERAILASIRSYASLRSTSYIFLVEDPSSDVVMERFKFYHELAHTSYMGCIVSARRYSKTFSFLVAAGVIAAMTPPSLGLFAIVAFFVLRAWWSWAGTPIESEMHADRSALAALGDPVHAEEIVGIFRGVWRDDPVRLLREYGSGAMRERDFRLWNMEAAVRMMRKAGGTDPKAVPLPGRDRVPLMFISYFAAGWAGWHSADPKYLGLAIVLGISVSLLFFLPKEMRALLASEKALEQAVGQRIQHLG